MEDSEEIKSELKRCKISYSEILADIGYAHVQRIYEELSKPLSTERKKVYLLAIKKAKERKLKYYEELYK